MDESQLRPCKDADHQANSVQAAETTKTKKLLEEDEKGPASLTLATPCRFRENR